MSKAIKQMQLDVLKHTFNDVRDLVMVNLSGLDAITENKVRLNLRKKGIRLQMVKNSLARKVFGELGFKISDNWGGPTTVAWGGNSLKELAKEVEKLGKDHPKFVKVKTAVADRTEVPFEQALKMPTRLEAIGDLVGMILGPGAAIASALVGPAGQVASQIQTISEKKEDAAPAA